jgi:hypothetical protein
MSTVKHLPKFDNTFCSQCGEEFGPGDNGFSHCSDHMHLWPGSSTLSAELTKDDERCVAPKVGETWYILRPGAYACDTVKIVEITKRTVLFHQYNGLMVSRLERLPLGRGLEFLERASEEGK